jgi:carbon-monoxide dehydrogenase small subunit
VTSKRQIRLTVNGVPYEVLVEPRTTLVDFLRGDLGLTGTHVGCEHGVCGACTVLVDGKAVRSCIMLAVQADGAALMTVEGLERDGELHPIQQAFREGHGLQCGFCTPGFLLTVYELLQHRADPDDGEIMDALGGQICRCTGYQSILASVRLAVTTLNARAASAGEGPRRQTAPAPDGSKSGS